MKRFIPFSFFLLILTYFFSGCGLSGKEQDLKKIKELEGRAEKMRTGQLNLTEGFDLLPIQELAIAYLDFADKYPDDPQTPDYIFKSAELYSQELQNIPRAIELFTRNVEQYPDHKTAPHALFLMGYLYNNTLKDFRKAETNYKLFLERYPNHELANSARFEVEQIGVPNEELLEKIRKREEQKDSLP